MRKNALELAKRLRAGENLGVFDSLLYFQDGHFFESSYIYYPDADGEGGYSPYTTHPSWLQVRHWLKTRVYR